MRAVEVHDALQASFASSSPSPSLSASQPTPASHPAVSYVPYYLLLSPWALQCMGGTYVGSHVHCLPPSAAGSYYTLYTRKLRRP